MHAVLVMPFYLPVMLLDELRHADTHIPIRTTHKTLCLTPGLLLA